MKNTVSNRSHKSQPLYALIPLCVVLLVIFLSIESCSKRDKSQKMGMEVPEVQVASAFAAPVTLHSQYPGFIRAGASADVVATVSGKLLSQNYKDGDYVRQGQVLFTIDPLKYRDAVQQAQASLSSARSQYAYASRQYEAMLQAARSDAVSEMEVLQSKNSAETAAAAVRNAEAQLATARENLSFCTIRAPRPGHCSAANLSVGNYINGEMSPVTLASVYDDSRVKVIFDIEDSRYETMMSQTESKEGSLLKSIPLVFKESLPHHYTADLSYVAPNVSTGTGTITLQGILDNPYNELKDGMYVTVNLPYGFYPEAVIVKDASIGTDQLGKYLYIVNDSDMVVLTHIEAGELYQDSLRIIKKGIKPGQRYVTEALLSVRQGMKVKPVQAK